MLQNMDFKKGCEMIPDKVFDYLESFSLKNTISLNHISPFIYKHYNPNFKINDLHWKYLISPYNQRLLKIDPNFALLEDHPIFVFKLNCHLEACYQPDQKIISIKFNNYFEEFVKNHQIEIVNNYVQDELNILSFMLYDKLFCSYDKKVSGFLNLSKELFKNTNDFHPNMRFKINPITPHIKNFLFEYEISIEEYLKWLEDNGFERKCKFKVCYTSNKISEIINSIDIELKYHFIKDVRISHVFKLNKSKKQYLLEILSKIKSVELKDYLINHFLHVENYEKFNNSLETFLKIPNLKNKIKNLVNFFDTSNIIESSFLLKCVNFEDLYEYYNYENLFSYVKWWLNLAKKFKYNKSDYLFIQGAFENNFKNECDVLQPHDEFLISLENIENELSRMLKNKALKESVPIIEPLNLEYKEIYGFKIVELVTVRQLKDEGDFQMHCVGGYKPTPKKRIFSIRWENSEGELRQTVQVSSEQVIQSQGKHRKSIAQYSEKEHKTLKHIENYLVQSMNQIHSEKIRKMSEEDLMLDELFE